MPTLTKSASPDSSSSEMSLIVRRSCMIARSIRCAAKEAPGKHDAALLQQYRDDAAQAAGTHFIHSLAFISVGFGGMFIFIVCEYSSVAGTTPTGGT